MLGKNQTVILNLFRKDIFYNPTIRNISVKLKKQYSLVYNAVQDLSNKKVLTLKEVGKSKMCLLNLSNEAKLYLSFLDEQESLGKKIPSIKEILEFKDFVDDIVLVTGSYASGKQTAKSDLDLVIITKDGAFNKQKLIANLTGLMTPKVHVFVLTYEDYVKMLTDKEANFGKEIFNNRLIYRNASRYYLLIKEAIENGFRG